MAAITASMVAELRGKTDAPMMECKKALTEAEGDMAKAEELLRVKLGSKAGKAASRITAEGVVATCMDGAVGAMVEVNCETDFVTKNDSFLALVNAAAALIAGFIWIATEWSVPGSQLAWPMFALALYSGLTMVTNVPFYSFKDLSMKRSVPFAVIVLIALGIAVINIDPPTVMFGLFVAYGLSGYVVYGWRRARGVRTSVISTSTDEPEERGLHQ